MTALELDDPGRPGETEEARGADGPGRRRGLVDRILGVPVALKIVLGSAVIASAAGVTALLVTRAPSTLDDGGRILLFALVVIALTAGLNWLMLRLALAPLADIARVSQRVREGDLSVRVPESPLADRPTRSLIVLFNEMLDAVQMGRSRQQELARTVVDAEEHERERIASDLYSGPAQTLASVLVQMRVARRRGQAALDAPRVANELRDEVATALDEIRTLARRLQPPELSDLGVRAALEAHARAVTEGVPVQVRVRGREPDGLDHDTALVLFRILQEAVTNAARHARAESIDVVFRSRPGHLVAEVLDDGVGFDPPRAGASPTTSGITRMRERAAYAGGLLDLQSAPGAGTRVRIDLPWLPRDRAVRTADADLVQEPSSRTEE